jgi:DNA-directed RNA polymerase specialized sigma24 family protein
MTHTPDPSAFDFIYTLAFRRTIPERSDADLDDAIQNACVKLLQQDRPVTRALARATIINCARDARKSQSRRSNREQRRAMSGGDPQVRRATKHRGSIRLYPDGVEPQFEDRNPSANIELRDVRSALKREIRAAKLSRDHRCALRAWLRGELPEYAKRNGIAASTARGRLKRALDAIRPCAARTLASNETDA